MPADQPDIAIAVRDLEVVFATGSHLARVVEGVSFDLRRGETLALVGESGSGKSVTCLSLLRLVRPPGRIVGGQAQFDGQDLLTLSERQMRPIRGGRIAMIFQDPATCLNPVFTVGDQIVEAIREHRDTADARALALDMLRRVGIADPERRLGEYPHQLSGGMRQRAMIAMALACDPDVLIADEPTTALDVTIQAQILDLLRELKGVSGQALSIMFVTHNMGVVAEIADRVAVMYAGRVVETGPVKTVFARPGHPYTKGLLGSIVPEKRAVRGTGRRPPLPAISGSVPDPRALPPGCAFAPRCPLVIEACRTAVPPLISVRPDQAARCIRCGDVS